MKENKKVVAFKYLPTQFPVTSTIAWWLLLDRVHAPGWLWGAAGLFVGLVWIAAIVGTIKEDHCEPAWKRFIED